ncbi:protein obstructor-E [Linepithema humile]|uniref:protein obstructor-E n=1 Tax=Linepithema humile TaxID=83485 RepID=UPI0006234EA9|nr:PREDICTED: probable chitinase 3 [Linepithema humile]
MKGIYLIAIAFLASCTVITAEFISVLEEEDECPVVDTCPPKLLFHETDCSKYYECKNGRKILQECARGLHFSKIWGGCLEPDKSECGKGATDCTKNGDLLAHECNCFKFYECKNNLKILHECPSGEHFSKSLRYCIKGTTCDDDEPANPECIEGVNLPHECRCEKYYVCKNNRKVLQECEEGSNFNKRTSTCVVGPCNRDPECEENTRKPHECNCTMYYTCQSEEWVFSKCSSGLHFNPVEQRCMHPVDAGCEKNPGDCKNSIDETWSHECDCRLYYRCVNKRKEILSCPWGRYFDENRLVCDYAENVKDNCKNSWDDWWLTGK